MNKKTITTVLKKIYNNLKLTDDAKQIYPTLAIQTISQKHYIKTIYNVSADVIECCKTNNEYIIIMLNNVESFTIENLTYDDNKDYLEQTHMYMDCANHIDDFIYEIENNM